MKVCSQLHAVMSIGQKAAVWATVDMQAKEKFPAMLDSYHFTS